MKEIRNARIESTHLGNEDHGILTIFLQLSYDRGSSQAFGGYNLTMPGQLGFWVNQILKVVGVEKWEDLKGKYIRVESDFGKVYRIGNLMEDSWFDPTTR